MARTTSKRALDSSFSVSVSRLSCRLVDAELPEFVLIVRRVFSSPRHMAASARLIYFYLMKYLTISLMRNTGAPVGEE